VLIHNKVVYMRFKFHGIVYYCEHVHNNTATKGNEISEIFNMK